jgi:hypothetical protein
LKLSFTALAVMAAVAEAEVPSPLPTKTNVQTRKNRFAVDAAQRLPQPRLCRRHNKRQWIECRLPRNSLWMPKTLLYEISKTVWLRVNLMLLRLIGLKLQRLPLRQLLTPSASVLQT